MMRWLPSAGKHPICPATGPIMEMAMTKWPLSIKKETGKELPAFSSGQGKLDWLVVNRPLLDEPVVIPPAYFKDKGGNSTPESDPVQRGRHEYCGLREAGYGY